MTPPTIRWADLDRLTVGAAACSSFRVDDALVARTAEVSGDHNPIHVDADTARRFGQSRPVAHGLILVGAISRLIGTELPGAGSVWFQNDIEFLAPMYVGDDVAVTVTIAQVSRAARVVVLDVDAVNGEGKSLARGRAKVRVPAPVQQQESVMQEHDRVALVTGGSRGIGRVVAETLAASGLSVVIGYCRNADEARACVGGIQARGGKAFAAAADVSTPEGARTLFERALQAFGRVDAVVHAASPAITYAPFADTSAETFHAYFDTYVIALAELTRLAAPAMKERQYGRIVTILSSAIAEVPQKLSAYVTAKHAALGLCRSLAVELGPWHITVNAVSPSMVIGHHTDSVGAAAREIMARKTPLRRLAEAEDVAGAVRFLVSQEGAFVSGANLPVTGGILFG